MVNQKNVFDLTKNTIASVNLDIEAPVANTPEKIVFELVEDEEEVVMPIINENELIGMSEFIKNLDVTFEIVSPIKDLDFVVSSPKVKEIEVVEPKVYYKEEQATLSFELPIPKSEPVLKEKEESKIMFELTNETRDIKVVEPVQFVPVTELTDNGIIRYTLEEYTEVENALLDSKPAAVIEEKVPEELNITMKKLDEEVGIASDFENISPMDMTIQESLKFRSDERRKKLKEFNYKFHNNISKIDELEREPAYKRLGLDISNPQTNSANSRISVGTDSNNDLQLRSNNSFLHDNVD